MKRKNKRLKLFSELNIGGRTKWAMGAFVIMGIGLGTLALKGNIEIQII